MKFVNSPIGKFPGKVGLKDPIPYPDYIAWEKALTKNADATQGEQEVALWGGVKQLVEDWNIADFDINNPPSSPRAAVVSLLAWLVGEIGKVINGEPDPNA